MAGGMVPDRSLFESLPKSSSDSDLRPSQMEAAEGSVPSGLEAPPRSLTRSTSNVPGAPHPPAGALCVMSANCVVGHARVRRAVWVECVGPWAAGSRTLLHRTSDKSQQ